MVAGGATMSAKQSNIRRTVAVSLVAAFAAVATGSGAQTPGPVVYVVPVEGVIDLGLAPFITRVLDEAQGAGAAAVILEINTFGGRVDAAVVIRDALLRAPVRTVAFVNKRAISAGALIALAAQTLAMADASTIGAATPVEVGAPGAAAQPVAEKTVSYMRKEFGATAESRKRPTLVAEAMVDADVEIADVIEKGKLLTLTTEEALRLKVADVRADDLGALLQYLGLGDAEVRHPSTNWAEGVVRVLTHPVVSGLLLALGILGLYVEMQTPGFAWTGAVGLLSLGLFFWGHWLVRLAGLEELVLAALGVVLLAVEIFVTPGFGVMGFLGAALLVSGLGFSLVGAGAPWEAILGAFARVAVSLLLALAGAFAAFRLLPRLPVGRRLILQTELNAAAGYASAPETDRRWLGTQGTTVSPLRPAGIAEFDGERIDVVSDGTFIEAGQTVEVLRVDGNRIVVARPRGSHQGASHDGN